VRSLIAGHMVDGRNDERKYESAKAQHEPVVALASRNSGRDLIVSYAA
jgi:hypothetical protein